MDALPVPDDSVDVLVNTLAMNHVRDLGPVFAEASRVLRPGGHFLISDVRGYFIGSDLTPLVEADPEGTVGYLPAWSHPTSTSLQAALPRGFAVRACRELRSEPWGEPDPDGDPDPVGPPTDEPLSDPPSIWEMHSWVPAAAAAVMGERVCLVIWHFQLDERP